MKFCSELFRRWADRYLASHPLVNGDMTHMVRQLEATQKGLPVEFYFFLREKRWKEYENQKDEILERLYAAVEDFGLSIYQLSIASPARQSSSARVVRNRQYRNSGATVGTYASWPITAM